MITMKHRIVDDNCGSLRGVGRAGALLHRGAGCIQLTALIGVATSALGRRRETRNNRKETRKNLPSNGKRAKSRAITDIVEFPESAHFTAVQPGWDEVAHYALPSALNRSVARWTPWGDRVRVEAGHAR